MNSISWFLYAIDVIGNLKFLAAAVTLAVALAWGVLNITVPVTDGEVLAWKDFRYWWTRGVVVILISGAVYSILPSRSTLYAIAASQVGEQIAQNQAVQGLAGDATRALQQWIRQQMPATPTSSNAPSNEHQ